MNSPILSININEMEIKDLCRQRIADLVNEVDAEFVFWDATELKKRTCMSWNFIQEQFFFDPRFPKHKVGSKWYFPARETRVFLERWLSEQSKA
jgi:hypothetical protein